MTRRKKPLVDPFGAAHFIPNILQVDHGDIIVIWKGPDLDADSIVYQSHPIGQPGPFWGLRSRYSGDPRSEFTYSIGVTTPEKFVNHLFSTVRQAVNVASEQEVVLYHGTTVDRLPSIWQHGLLTAERINEMKIYANWGLSQGVCLTPNYGLAEWYGGILGKPAVLAVRATPYVDAMIPDPSPDHAWGHSFVVRHNIAKEDILGYSLDPDRYVPHQDDEEA